MKNERKVLPVPEQQGARKEGQGATHKHVKQTLWGNFPDGPVVGTPRFQSRGPWLEI